MAAYLDRVTKRGGLSGSGDKTWRLIWIWRQNVAAYLDRMTKRGGLSGSNLAEMTKRGGLSGSRDKTWRLIWIKKLSILPGLRANRGVIDQKTIGDRVIDQITRMGS